MNYEWGLDFPLRWEEEQISYGKGKSENIILEKTFLFAIRIIRLQQFLVRERKEYVLSKQIIRSGTSIGANPEEAMAASSRRDFIAKLDIAAKEVRETSYFLRLLHQTDFITDNAFQSIHLDCLELKKIISSILITTKATSPRIVKS